MNSTVTHTSGIVSTAAGDIDAHMTGFSYIRGGTRMWVGQMTDGRWAVASRFQYEIRTKFKMKAFRKFEEMVRDEAKDVG